LLGTKKPSSLCQRASLLPMYTNLYTILLTSGSFHKVYRYKGTKVKPHMTMVLATAGII
jgi:hypothetical protein